MSINETDAPVEYNAVVRRQTVTNLELQVPFSGQPSDLKTTGPPHCARRRDSYRWRVIPPRSIRRGGAPEIVPTGALCGRKSIDIRYSQVCSCLLIVNNDALSVGADKADFQISHVAVLQLILKCSNSSFPFAMVCPKELGDFHSVRKALEVREKGSLRAFLPNSSQARSSKEV